MPSEPSVETLVSRAREEESKYNWLEAEKCYEQVLNVQLRSARVRATTRLSVADMWAKIASCYDRASCQAESTEEFRKLKQQASRAHRTAAQLFEKEDSNSGEKSAQCHAAAEYESSWLASNCSEKIKLLDNCRILVRKSLAAYEGVRDKLSYGKTCATFLFSLYERLNIASGAEEKRTVGHEGIDCAEKTISILSESGNKNELILALSAASLQSWYLANITEQEDKRKTLADRSLGYSEKALALSKHIDNAYSIAMSRWAAAMSKLFFTEDIESSMQQAQEMLQQGCILRDNYVKGVALNLLAFVTDWMILKEATPEKKKEKCEEGIKFAEESVRYLQLVCQDSLIAETQSYQVEAYSTLARDIEVEMDRKRAFSGKAIEIGRKGLEHAVRSGSPDATGSILHALSKALHYYSDLEPRKDIRKELLEEALTHRRGYLEIVEKTFPSNDWVLGVGKYYAGLVGTELSKLEMNDEKKITLLQRGISDMGQGVAYCTKWISSRPVPSLIVTVAEFEDNLGGRLTELYSLTGNVEDLRRAIEAYCGAAERFEKTDLPSREAECNWKIARNKDYMGNYEEAAESFIAASRQYTRAAKKIHQFSEFFLEYASYMEAWSEIEAAKSAHRDEEYLEAKSHYENAAKLLEHSKLWCYLSPNFGAWSLLEHAEDLSRNEKTKESMEAFKEAVKLFAMSRQTVEKERLQLERSEVIDEKEMVNELAQISNAREEYCLGRIAVEEAKILDAQGDHAASSRKYGYAIQRFQKAIDVSKHESDMLELKPIICLCRAWQTMTRAEAEASPNLYLEASKLFDEAKQNSYDEKAKLLAMGHSWFCKALEAGARFEGSRDVGLHLTATQHLESATNYYIRAGFEVGSEYAIATQRLFDGYAYMDNASKETDPEKRAKYYTMAEKVLKISAQSYLKAKHDEKAKQVQALLDRVQEKRELAASLTEVLHAPGIASSTASFAIPTPAQEKAVGLERFEHANIQAHLTVPEEVPMEQDVEFQLDLVNVAKNFGLLVRIDGFMPIGFKLTAISPEYAIDDGSISLGGKRFESLKVESIKISARATDFGIFKISPQVIYIDETGQFRTCFPDVAHVKVLAPHRIQIEERAKRKYEIVYKDLLAEHPKALKNECRVAIAQIGLSTTDDVVTEYYEEKAPGIFGIRPEKFEAVRSKVRSMIESAHTQKVNILLFPELTVDLNYKELLSDITNLAKTYRMYIIPGSYHIEKTKRNISVVIGPEGIAWEQEKHIPAMIYYEGKRLTEGIEIGVLPRKTTVCNTEYGRMAILICRDFLDMDLRVELKNFEPPVDLVFNPAFTPVTADFRAAHFDARRSVYAYCFFANVAEFGDSFIYTPEKERVERMIPGKEENIIFKDVDIFNLRSERKKWEKEKKQFIQSTR
jgi:predicted amidohydrolase